MSTLGQLAFDGDEDALRQRFAAGASPNDPAEFMQGFPVLCIAAQLGHVNVMRVLLEAGASLEATRSQTGANALLMAAHNGHVECAEALLKGGANPEATNNNGFTALLKAAQNGHASCVEALLKRGANPEATEPKWGATSLIQAAFAGQPESIRALLQGGAKLEATGKTRGTALHAAAQEGCAGCVEALVKGGANP